MDTLKSRAGFTLAEVMVALVMTAVIGAAVTGVFVTQSRFFDHNEKVASARDVSQRAMNLITSELRMLEQAQGVLSATNKRLTMRAPYAMGVICDTVQSKVTISLLPVDPFAWSMRSPTGYAHRQTNGTYVYHETTQQPQTAAGNAAICTNRNIPLITDGGGNFDGRYVHFNPLPAFRPTPGAAVLLFQEVTYEFKASSVVSGRTGLFRRTAPGTEVELLAPFDTSAMFRFYNGDASAAQDAVPPTGSITGIELVLDGLSLRPERNGSRQRAPLRTSVFFKNRL